LKRRHLERCLQPWGCTFLTCGSKRFSSKNDWKAHENSEHFQAELWRCDKDDPDDGLEACGKVFYRKDGFMDHLKDVHCILDSESIKATSFSCRIDRNCQSRFWCGFCTKILELTQKGIAAWDERFDHIDDHFMGRHGLAKQDIRAWAPVDKRMALESSKKSSKRKRPGSHQRFSVEPKSLDSEYICKYYDCPLTFKIWEQLKAHHADHSDIIPPENEMSTFQQPLKLAVEGNQKRTLDSEIGHVIQTVSQQLSPVPRWSEWTCDSSGAQSTLAYSDSCNDDSSQEPHLARLSSQIPGKATNGSDSSHPHQSKAQWDSRNSESPDPVSSDSNHPTGLTTLVRVPTDNTSEKSVRCSVCNNFSGCPSKLRLVNVSLRIIA